MSRLADIYRSEKAKGGGLGSTLGKAALEKIDPRRMFNQSGLMAAMLPSLFKSYSATGSKINTTSPQSTQGSESQLSSIATDSKINAKNSIVLPTMARDMNVMRQNIVKLVKLQGGKASTKADMFFKSSAEREAEYESKFKKESKSTPSGSGATSGASGPGKSMKGIGLDFLSSVMGGAGAALGGVGKGIGIAAIGLGIGGFFAGLATGGAAVNALGGTSGVKDMLVNLAEGLSAFSGTSLLAFGALLGAGMLFGPVAAAKGALGITAIGLGIGGFLAGLSVGGAVVNALGGASGVKDMMVNLAEGLGAFSGLDAGNLAKLALAIPAFGVGMLAFFGLQGIGGLVQSFTSGMKGIMDWIFGNDKSGKTPMQQLASDLQLFQNINGDNLSKVGQGFKDLASGLLGFAKVTEEDLVKASRAAAAASQMSKSIPGASSGAPQAEPVPIGNEGRRQPLPPTPSSTSPQAEPVPIGNEGRRQPLPPTPSSTSPTRDSSTGAYRGLRSDMPSTSPTKQTTATIGDAPGLPIDYKSYATKIGEKESGGKYDAVNTLGYLGKYQFGAMALEDMGLVKKGVGKKGLKALDVSDNWTIPGGKQAFLSNAQLQEDTMKRYTMQNYKTLNRLGVVNKNSSSEQVAGYLASSHLLGPGGALDLSKGKSGSDAYGTSAASYFKVGVSTQMPTMSTASAAATLASSFPSTGTVLASSSTSVADQKLAAASSGQTVVVNAPQTNVQATQGVQRSSGNVPSAVDTDFMRHLVAQMAT